MNFAEKRTPNGFVIKIMFDHWNFSIFNSKGEAIYLSDANKSLINPVPTIILIGNTFTLKLNYHSDYYILKVKNGKIFIPYKDILENRLKYADIQYDCNIDMIPAKILKFKSMAEVIRDVDITSTPDIVCVDTSIPEYDILIIKQRYKMDEIHKLKSENVNARSTAKARNINLNMISSNIVFLAIIHIRNTDIAKMNQLMLDFDVTEFEIEYILTFINEAYSKDNQTERSKYMLESLKEAFTFYSYLLVRNDEAIRQMIETQSDETRASFFKTLVMKVKLSSTTGEDQYSEYEIMLLNKIDELYAKIDAHTFGEDVSFDIPKMIGEPEETDTDNKNNENIDSAQSEAYDSLIDTSLIEESLNEKI